MTDTSGPTSQEPFAFYDHDSSCLRTSQGTFLSDSMKSSVTLPKWGSMRSGALYERPTLVRPTAESDFSLLPTPAGNDMGGGVHAGGMGRVDGQDEGETRQRQRSRQKPVSRGSETLLPTPNTLSYKDSGRCQDWGGDLTHALTCDKCQPTMLLPTPTARDWKDTGDFTYRDKSILPHEIQRLGEERWGIYAPAIARWEAVLGRPAPEPTDDKRRLNPAFVAWMMGLPENWLHGTRTQQLKQCGNAVVPQQGAYALRALAGTHKVFKLLGEA